MEDLNAGAEAGAGAQPIAGQQQNNVNAQVVNIQAQFRGFISRKKINIEKNQNAEKK
ncbi:hypothetical protein pb186bvf_014607 [Paramecium bursaria]